MHFLNTALGRMLTRERWSENGGVSRARCSTSCCAASGVRVRVCRTATFSVRFPRKRESSTGSPLSRGRTVFAGLLPSTGSLVCSADLRTALRPGHEPRTRHLMACLEGSCGHTPSFSRRACRARALPGGPRFNRGPGGVDPRKMRGGRRAEEAQPVRLCTRLFGTAWRLSARRHGDFRPRGRSFRVPTDPSRDPDPAGFRPPSSTPRPAIEGRPS